MSQASDDERPRVWIYAAVALTGLCVMGAELATARLVAPFYGTSTFVWSTIIGAVLGAMALGHLVGGRLSRTRRPMRALVLVLLAAAGSLAALPVAAPPMMESTLEWFVGGRFGILAASLLGVTALIAIPLLALGACSPMLLHLVVGKSDHVGSVASRVYAAGTIGSLVGTYLTGLLLIPWLGTSATIYALAAALMVVALLGAAFSRIFDAWVVGASLIACTPALGLGASQTEAGVVVERETAHNHVSITDSAYRRTMRFNDGYAIQSVLPHDGSLYLDDIWGQFATGPAFLPQTRSRGRLLVLGLGGGSAARNWRELYPGWSIVGVEIDAEVIDLGERYMDMPADIETHAADARSWLRRDERQFDVIIVDAFEFPYIPFHLTTREFFAQVASHLRPEGAVLINVGRDGHRDRLVHAIGRTVRTSFEHLQRANLRNRSNALLVATDHGPENMVGLQALGLRPIYARRLARLRRPEPFEPAERAIVLTDDHAPIEWMTDLTLLEHVLDES